MLISVMLVSGCDLRRPPPPRQPWGRAELLLVVVTWSRQEPIAIRVDVIEVPERHSILFLVGIVEQSEILRGRGEVEPGQRHRLVRRPAGAYISL